MNPISNVPLTLAQISELLEASKFVSWENSDFTSAVTTLESSKKALEQTVESVIEAAKGYDYVLRMPDDTLHMSDLLPARLRDILEHYKGHIARLETLSLNEFASRMAGRDRRSPILIAIDAGELRRWVELMKFTEDSVVNHNALPSQFEYVDGVYDESDCQKILGEAAVAYFRQQLEAPEVSA